MALEKQPLNQLARYLGTGEFWFAEGFATPQAALGKAFRDFQNLTATVIQSSHQSKQMLSSRRGVRVEEGDRITLMTLGYQLKTDVMTAENARYLVYGDADPLGNYTQSARAAAAADAIAAPVKGPWYDLTIGGVELRNLTAVAIVSTPAVVEDLDYVIDYLNSAIRWLTTPPGTITSISLTAPAITATSVLTLARTIPRSTPIRRGIGRILLYDRIQAAQDLVYRHKDFYCQVMANGNFTADGQNVGEITIDVKILTPSGSVWHRETDFSS
jgi:hypothetical protein